MGGVDFFATRMGVRFYETTIPKIADQLARLANAFEAYVTELRRANDRRQPTSGEPAERVAPDEERWPVKLATIARDRLGVETLEERGAEWLDVHDIGVEDLRKALGEAYRAGLAAGIQHVVVKQR